MGLLDDAIREHLALKRRSGASEDEIRRLESEALTEPAPAAPEPVATEPALDVDVAVMPEPEPPVVPAAREPDPVVAEQTDWLDEPDEVPASESLAAAPVAPVRDPAPRPHGRPTVEQETHEFTPEDVFADDDHVEPDEEPAEDVLEETPEFLQETPEHDRLWFEQKPPRDFDFGG